MVSLANRSFLVFGLGQSAKAAVELLLATGADVFLMNSGAKKNWSDPFKLVELVGDEKTFSDKEAEKYFEKVNTIVISPGIPSDLPVIRKAKAKGINVISELELGYKFIQSRIIAVTGSNGKTTTVKMLESICKNANKNIFVGGNIGTPLSVLAKKIVEGEKNPELVLLEVSSFQLENIEEFRPDIAVCLNISPCGHSERYKKVEEYKNAKMNIVKNMEKEDTFFYPFDDRTITRALLYIQLKTRDLSPHRAIPILKEKFDVSEFKLRGDHNLINMYTAASVASTLDIEDEHIQKTINEFEVLPHRLEKVNEFNHFSVINDSKSTNFESMITALDSFSNDDEVYLVLGGQQRSARETIKPFTNRMKRNVKKVFAFGQAKEKLTKDLSKDFEIVSLENLNELKSKIDNKFKGILLFSPAFPSFDQFGSYKERGEYFKGLWTH